MEKEQMAPHVDDIIRALGEKLDRKAVESELQNYTEQYRVPLDVAKRSIVKKHGGDVSALSVGTARQLSDLRPGEQSIEILCRVITVNPKEIEVEGRTKSIFYGLVTDGSATLPYTAWEIEGFKADRGDVIRATNAYTNNKEWNGKPQLNFGSRTRVSRESRELLKDIDAAPQMAPLKKVTVADLKQGLRNISITARIISVQKREITVKEEKKEVYSGILGDGSGQAQFSAWDDFKLKENEVVSISGGYISLWRGLPQLNFDSGARVERVKDAKFPSVKDIAHSPPVDISSLQEKGGCLGAAVSGIVADIRPGSGLVFRCAQCKRVTDKGNCKLHGRVETTPDLRTKAVIDDGTGTVVAILNRELTESLLGMTLEQAIKAAKEAMDMEKIHAELAEKLVATQIAVRGSVSSDEFGLTMIATHLDEHKTDVQAEASRMLQELE